MTQLLLLRKCPARIKLINMNIYGNTCVNTRTATYQRQDLATCQIQDPNLLDLTNPLDFNVYIRFITITISAIDCKLYTHSIFLTFTERCQIQLKHFNKILIYMCAYLFVCLEGKREPQFIQLFGKLQILGCNKVNQICCRKHKFSLK